jgi:hypothetical protein
MLVLLELPLERMVAILAAASLFSEMMSLLMALDQRTQSIKKMALG